jgi:hypothetical protein
MVEELFDLLLFDTRLVKINVGELLDQPGKKSIDLFISVIHGTWHG